MIALLVMFLLLTPIVGGPTVWVCRSCKRETGHFFFPYAHDARDSDSTPRS